jgi:hypothetical protein
MCRVSKIFRWPAEMSGKRGDWRRPRFRWITGARRAVAAESPVSATLVEALN